MFMGALRKPEEASDSLELNLQAAVSHSLRGLEANAGPLEELKVLITVEPFLQPHLTF